MYYMHIHKMVNGANVNVQYTHIYYVHKYELVNEGTTSIIIMTKCHSKGEC